jgi:hypothetical protein
LLLCFKEMTEPAASAGLLRPLVLPLDGTKRMQRFPGHWVEFSERGTEASIVLGDPIRLVPLAVAAEVHTSPE